MANVTVSLTPAQFNWLQNVVTVKVQEECTSNPNYSGNLSDAPTFLQGNLVLAQGVSAALKAGVVL